MTTFVHTALIDSGDSDGPNIILATTYDVLIRCIAENYAEDVLADGGTVEEAFAEAKEYADITIDICGIADKN